MMDGSPMMLGTTPTSHKRMREDDELMQYLSEAQQPRQQRSSSGDPMSCPRSPIHSGGTAGAHMCLTPMAGLGGQPADDMGVRFAAHQRQGPRRCVRLQSKQSLSLALSSAHLRRLHRLCPSHLFPVTSCPG